MASQGRQAEREALPCYISDFFIFKPCFGIRLDLAVKSIAVVNMIFGAMLGSTAAFGLVFFGLRTQEVLEMLNNLTYGPLVFLRRLGPVVLVCMLFLLVLLSIVLYFIGVLLWTGAREHCYGKVNRWWKIALILVTVNIFVNLAVWVSSAGETGLVVFQVFDSAIFFYFLWVVNIFRKSIEPRRVRETPRELLPISELF